METAAKPLTAKDLLENPEILSYIEKADQVMEAIGYTEHGRRHATLVSRIARDVLAELQADPRRVELAAIAGLLHDVGNFMGREMHAQAGAIVAFTLLSQLGMDPCEIADIGAAIGNHEAWDLLPCNDISAAVVLADKADVHKTRVRKFDPNTRDIHDRVNGAAERAFLRVDPQERTISLEITIDTTFSSVMDYFEIFLDRMIQSRRAAEILGCDFHLYINDVMMG